MPELGTLKRLPLRDLWPFEASNFTLWLADQWLLEITPTYLFTDDGATVYRFHEDRLSKIKQIEKNRSVLSALLMWADYLRSTGTSALFTPSPMMEFGELLTVEAQVGISDEAWHDPEESLVADDMFGEEAAS